MTANQIKDAGRGPKDVMHPWRAPALVPIGDASQGDERCLVAHMTCHHGGPLVPMVERNLDP